MTTSDVKLCDQTLMVDLPRSDFWLDLPSLVPPRIGAGHAI